MFLKKIVTVAAVALGTMYAQKTPKKIKYNREGRLYNLESGEVSIARYRDGGRGRGAIEMTLKSGEILRGEYTTVPDGDTSWGAVFGRVGAATGSDRGLGRSLNNRQRGSAIVASENGTVVECEYIVSAIGGHGNGYCQDNKQGRYKLMFGKQ